MKYVWVFIALLVLAGGGYFLLQVAMLWNPAPTVACTTDMQLCTDGSYVSRQGPKCEFAQCPPDPARPPMATSSAHIIGRLGQVSSVLGMMMTPLELVEDSRCPIDAHCIQAGTVRLRVKTETPSGAAEQIISLGQTITTDITAVTLTSVSPAQTSHPAAPSSYLFSFTVEKR